MRELFKNLILKLTNRTFLLTLVVLCIFGAMWSSVYQIQILDAEHYQEIAAEILKAAGFIVDVAEDGIVAVDKMAEAASDFYDLILMDIQMKFMDGMTAAEEIRKMDSEVVIMFITNMTNYAIR